MEGFPYSTDIEGLEKKDFLRFSGLFSEIVSSSIPTVEAIRFVENSTPFSMIFSDAQSIRKLTTAFTNLKNGDLQAAVVADTIVLGFHLQNNGFIAAVVTKVDPVLLKRIAEDWLLEIREFIEREFLHVKMQYQEPETGLLNSAHLFSVLESTEDEREKGLMLVELALPRRAVRNVFRSAQQMAADLSLYFDERFFIYHLGQSVFGLVVQDCSNIQLEQVSAGLVQHLRKEGYARVQIGIGRQVCSEEKHDCKKLLDTAWSALKTAGRRGPFSFCDYGRLVDSAAHPLHVASLRVIRKLQRLAKKDRRFCLVKLSAKVAKEDVTTIMALVGGEGVYLIVDDDGGVFIFLSGYGPDQAVDYTMDLVKQVKAIGGMEKVYCGISSFPYADFTRSETIRNVQKAVLHAAFFGPGSVVLFEALSLNVSGDVYFSDGDLPAAVAEYKRGLVCDCNDVNLLNSLGVAYALLNRGSLARQTFDNVLEIDPENYMALYNLGLDAMQRKNVDGAIGWFEKAGGCCDDSEEAAAVKKDITLQLGVLYCQVGRFDEALELLKEWQKNVPETRHGAIFKYLGEAFLGIGDNGNAMMWLQRALQYNEFDAEAMSLLGTAILRKDEGDEIALSLCSKGVELAPDKPALHLRLAEARLQNGKYREVLRSLNHCNGKSIEKGAVYLLKARTYAALENSVKAKQWAQEVLLRYPASDPYYKEAEVLYQALA